MRRLKKIAMLIGTIIALLIFLEKPSSVTSLSSEEKIVYTYTELKDALSINNEITKIYLGADISVTGGILINTNKKTVSISGTDPNTLIRHKLIETQAGGSSSNIYVNTNNTTNNITLKDIEIVGKNYYGIITIHDGARNISLTYENIVYKGPQLAYNVNGVIYFKGDNLITIDNRNVAGSDELSEVSESSQVSVSGKLTVVNPVQTNHAMFYLHGSLPLQFTVEDHAEVHLQSNSNDGVIYGSEPNLLIGNNVIFDVITAAIPLTDGGLYLKNISVGTNSIFQVASNKNTTAVINSTGDITIDKGSIFKLSASGGATGGLLYLTKTGAKITLNEPKLALFYKDNASSTKPINFNSNGSIIVTSHMIRYWQTSNNGGFEDTPLEHWERSSGNLLSTTIPMTGTTSGTVSLPDDVTDTKKFQLNTGRVLAIGSLPVTLNTPVKDVDTAIFGSTSANTPVRLQSHVGGTLPSVTITSSQSNETGNFSFAQTLPPYSQIEVQANWEFLVGKSPQTVISDTVPPTGEAILQIIPVGATFTKTANELIRNINDNSIGTINPNVSAELTAYPDLTRTGATSAEVILRDHAGNQTLIQVPIFVTDEETIMDEHTLLHALDFTTTLQMLSEKTVDELHSWILTMANASGYNLINSQNITSEIQVTTSLSNQSNAGTYTALLTLGAISKEIHIQVTGTLELDTIPEIISFNVGKISPVRTLYTRAGSVNLIVKDTRALGSRWQLEAAIETPLISNKGHSLENALVFVDQNHKITPLSNNEMIVYQQSKSEETLIQIDWPADQGILIYPPLFEAYVGETYRATIIWTLLDVP